MRWRGCAAAWQPVQTKVQDQMMTTCPETSTNSVTNLRAAYGLLCKAGLEETYAAEVDLRTGLHIDRDFATLAHPHQEPPQVANNGGPAGAAPARRRSPSAFLAEVVARYAGSA